jgi:hypothetical protein
MYEIPERDYEESVTNYKDQWRTLDGVLYTLCRDYPGHDRIDSINAKLNIIGRTYSTGIERRIRSEGTQGSSMLKLADYFFKHRAEIDSLIEHISALMEPLTWKGIVAILIAHGRLVQLLTGITQNGTDRAHSCRNTSIFTTQFFQFMTVLPLGRFGGSYRSGPFSISTSRSMV